jgi:hypothetical protein
MEGNVLPRVLAWGPTKMCDLGHFEIIKGSGKINKTKHRQLNSGT